MGKQLIRRCADTGGAIKHLRGLIMKDRGRDDRWSSQESARRKSIQNEELSQFEKRHGVYVSCPSSHSLTLSTATRLLVLLSGSLLGLFLSIILIRVSLGPCRGSIFAEGSLYTSIPVPCTWNPRLTYPFAVSTSHQKVVLEIDFSGVLWVSGGFLNGLESRQAHSAPGIH